MSNNISTAAREYASRPADERFPSLDAMIASALHEQELSKQVSYNLKDLKAVAGYQGPNGIAPNFPISTRPEHADKAVYLESPKGIARFTHWSFGQLCRTLGAPAGYLRSIPASIAADALNFGLRNSPVGETANLLVRAPNGTPEPVIRAATSDKYDRVWDAPLYDAVRQQITSKDDRWTTPPTWSGEPAGAYRGDRDSFLILVNGGSIVTDPSLTNRAAQNIASDTPRSQSSGRGPSDGMYRGILIRNSEVGASSVQIEQILFRYICGNHMLWGAVIDRKFRRRHIGANTLRDTVRTISTIAWEFAQASPARDEAIIRGLISNELAHTKEGVVDELRKIGFSKDQAEKAYDACERTEAVSPRSFWGIAQGTTRLSQDSTSGYQDDRYLLDQLAGKVLARGAQLVKV